MTAEPQGPAMPTPEVPSSSLLRRWLYGITVAVSPFLLSGAVWLAYHQGAQDTTIELMKKKQADDIMVATTLETRDVTNLQARHTRLRDDFDAEKRMNASVVNSIHDDIATMKQLLKDRLPEPPQRHASVEDGAVVVFQGIER